MLRSLKFSPIAVLFLCLNVHAGACPSGANYISISSPTGASVTAASLGCLNAYYISSSSGSDSNTGADESHPWKFAPGMPNCASNCASHSVAAGDWFIFKGADTWDFGNSGAAAYTGGVWSVPSGGSSSQFLYFGVDPGWPSSGWSRPILSADNPTSASAVASCSYKVSGSSNRLVNMQGERYYYFDDFELADYCANSASDANNYLSYGGAGSGFLGNHTFFILRNYIHGWTVTSAVGDGSLTAFASGVSSWGVTLWMNVVDGSDSDPHPMGWAGQCGDVYEFAYNYIAHFGGITAPCMCHNTHDNIWTDFENANDGVTHSDMMQCESEAGNTTVPRAGDGTPNVWYNNLRYSIPTGVSAMWLLTPNSKGDFVFNNVTHDYTNGSTNYENICDTACPEAGTLAIFNNTYEAGLNSGTPQGCVICNNAATNITITAANNHWITNSGSSASAVFQSTTHVTETTPVYQTLSVANGQGYQTSNHFAPTSGTNSTVGAGANETSNYCSTLQSDGAETVAVTSCEAGTTLGISYNSSTHSVSYPAQSANARPSSGAWDAGAYEFSAGIAAAGVGVGILP